MRALEEGLSNDAMFASTLGSGSLSPEARGGRKRRRWEVIGEDGAGEGSRRRGERASSPMGRLGQLKEWLTEAWKGLLS